MRVAVNRKFLDFLGGSVAYVYGTGAHLDPSDPGMTSDALARSLLNCVERSYYHMVTGRVDARMPVLRTNVTAVLRWDPGTTLTPIDLFADHADIFTKAGAVRGVA